MSAPRKFIRAGKVNPGRIPEFDEKLVRDISEAVYRERLGDTDVVSMIAIDKDGGEKLRERAKSYDSLTISYLKIFTNRAEKAKNGD